MDMSRHLGRRALLRFTLPSIAMMILTSVYGVVDGLFVSNCAGTTAFGGQPHHAVHHDPRHARLHDGLGRQRARRPHARRGRRRAGEPLLLDDHPCHARRRHRAGGRRSRPHAPRRRGAGRLRRAAGVVRPVRPDLDGLPAGIHAAVRLPDLRLDRRQAPARTARDDRGGSGQRRPGPPARRRPRSGRDRRRLGDRRRRTHRRPRPARLVRTAQRQPSATGPPGEGPGRPRIGLRERLVRDDGLDRGVGREHRLQPAVAAAHRPGRPPTARSCTSAWSSPPSSRDSAWLRHRS